MEAQQAAGNSRGANQPRPTKEDQLRQHANFFLWNYPDFLAYLKELTRGYQIARQDTSNPAEADRLRKKLTQNLIFHEQDFVKFYSILQRDSTVIPQMVEFFDQQVQANLSWFAQLVDSPAWLQLHLRLNSTEMERLLRGEGFHSLQDLRQRERDFALQLLDRARKVPSRFRRQWFDRWKRYEVPPVPREGYAVLQRRLAQQLSKLPPDFASIVLVKALISETGEVLRATVAKSSGNALADRAAREAVQSVAWDPALYQGKPFKTDVLIPLRIDSPAHF